MPEEIRAGLAHYGPPSDEHDALDDEVRASIENMQDAARELVRSGRAAEVRAEAAGELATLGQYARLSRGQQDRRTTLLRQVAAIDNATQRRRDLDRIGAVARGGAAALASGLRVEHGSGGYVGEPADPEGTAARRSTGHPTRDAALRVLDARRDVDDHARQRAAVAIDTARGDELDVFARWTAATLDPQYERAVGRLFADPVNGHREWTREELTAFQNAQQVQRAMSLTPSAGGFLVPFVVDPAIMLTNAGSVNPMRSLARVVTTATDRWAGITSAGVVASWDAEAAEVSDDSPTLGQPVIPVHKAAAFVSASIEVAADSTIPQQVGALFADAKDQLEATAHTLGTGTGQPRGVITGAVATPGSVVAVGGSALSVADIYALQNALPPRWRARASFMANLTIINSARQLIAGTGLTMSILDDTAAQPRMLGWNVNENSAMDGVINATANDYVLMAGDFQQYVIVDRVGLTVEFIPHLFSMANGRPTGQRGWYAHWRTGGDLVIPDAMRVLNYSA